ncbi:succinate dehydrogenase assembly factor 2 [Roseobacter sp. YSTF-M11]|uniref:Succinate dehydrogenase assembly factor 2 n=1 Tax=Roseobacter insulae TaxID=2859783 RepID=A0A9X1G0J8_9RHOB|nr:succinate dehydrogenase assembly factor 2 [Roseobacter insulae]MBW4710303.1 succinate dehydrogenase assembly factor 2 [Roseobacter insulae]
MNEPRDHRIKRLKMRSMRRGIKEMDLILQRFAEANLDAMDDAGLDLYDAMLSENDHDLYQWVSGQTEVPDVYVDLMGRIIAQLPEAHA